jgi:hypothetical protein
MVQVRRSLLAAAPMVALLVWQIPGAVEPVVPGLRPASTQAGQESGDSTCGSTSVGAGRDGTALSAEAFTQSIGVNIHLSYLDQRLADGTAMVDRIKASGITQLRESMDVADPDFEYPGDTAAVRELLSAGRRFTLITDYREQPAQQVHDWIARLGPQYIVSVENSNEPDLFQARADGTWPVAKVRAYQKRLYRAINADPATRDIEVLGPSVTTEDAAQDLGGSLATFMDRANIHNYQIAPEFGTPGDDDGFPSLDYFLRKICGPVRPTDVSPVSTETGYDNSTAELGKPESVVGRYLPRQMLFSFAAGIPRSYAYEFYDEGTDRTDPQQNFGLIRNDGSAKPSFTALQSMIELLRDPGAEFTPGHLDYRIAGGPKDLQQVVLQKSDGTFFLALWRGASSWDVDTRTELSVPDVRTTVTVPSDIKQAVAHRLDDNGELVATTLDTTGCHLRLPVGDELTFLELVPAD